MPKKVPFRVIYCTGWEDDYPPKDLEVTVVASLACGAVLLPWFLSNDFLPALASLPIDISAGSQPIHKGMEIPKVSMIAGIQQINYVRGERYAHCVSTFGHGYK